MNLTETLRDEPRSIAERQAASERPEIPEDDPRVISALEEYVLAAEKGNRPDRRAFLARHRAVATALAPCLEGVDLLRQTRAELSTIVPELGDASAFEPDRRLGDFRILRQIGRGGMGVVYEAEQCSLGRRVALKVLPYGGTLDPRQRLRFQAEAQAAAHLHHPHIVPVYSVGCERDVPYYAMQYIEGQSLAALIGQLRRLDGEADRVRGSDSSTERQEPEKPAADELAFLEEPVDSLAQSGPLVPQPGVKGGRAYCRFVARLGIQAAEALDHAHALGIVHRDIKPGNLLLDARSNVWVTDFGLARLQGDSDLTHTGDLVGTLRYMSPEQARGGRAVVDSRTDVYSLGVTLYELLTLRAAVGGRDRQELLRRIAEEHPTPPRRLNPAIPRDLETIILKALAKEPSGRYATAKDLADDLHRFLEDKPIEARRPSPVERLGMWARRHKGVVTGAAIVAMCTLAGLAAATMMIASAYRAESAERERAESNLEIAIKALDRICLHIAETRFARDPKREQEDRELIQVALNCFDQLSNQNVQDPRARFTTARAYGRVGDVRAQLGQREGAEVAYNRAIYFLRGLATDYPSNPIYLDCLASGLLRKANLLRQQHRFKEAENGLREALTLRRATAGGPAEINPTHRGDALNDLGVLLVDTHRYHEASAAFEEALEIQKAQGAEKPDAPPDLREQLADTRNNLGGLLLLYSSRPQAEREFRTALEIQSELTRRVGKPVYREREAVSHANLGSVLTSTGRPREAVESYEQAIRIQRALVQEAPNAHDYRHALARSLAGYSRALASSKRDGVARAAAREAQDLLDTLVDSDESDAPRRHLGKDYLFLSEVLHSLGMRDAAERAYQQALRCDPVGSDVESLLATSMNNLAWWLATDPEPRLRNPARAVDLAKRALALAPRAGTFWNTLGVAYFRNAEWEPAEAAFRESIRLRYGGGDAYDWFFLAMIAHRKGDVKSSKAWFEKSVDWMSSHMPCNEELRRFRNEAAAALGLRTGDEAIRAGELSCEPHTTPRIDSMAVLGMSALTSQAAIRPAGSGAAAL